MSIERIEWLDSSNRSGWHEIEEVSMVLAMAPCYSCGFVVAEDDQFVYMSTTIADDACLSPVSIPKAAIVARRTVDLLAGTDY